MLRVFLVLYVRVVWYSTRMRDFISKPLCAFQKCPLREINWSWLTLSDQTYFLPSPASSLLGQILMGSPSSPPWVGMSEENFGGRPQPHSTVHGCVSRCLSPAQYMPPPLLRFFLWLPFQRYLNFLWTMRLVPLPISQKSTCMLLKRRWSHGFLPVF